MGKDSAIPWCHHTFNPWWGCTKVSPGCANCYAESLAKRTGCDCWGANQRRFFGSQHWQEPFRWDRDAERLGERHRVFCGSMCDIFEDLLALEAPRRDVFKLTLATPNLHWLLLTKRPHIAAEVIPIEWFTKKAPSNVWFLTTVESPLYLHRVNHIKQIPGVVHGLSMEPLLADVPTIGERLDDIEWVIVGAESGPKRRPFSEDWVRRIRDACVERGIAFFYKQRIDNGRKIELPELDGQVWAQFPEAELRREGQR